MNGKHNYHSRSQQAAAASFHSLSGKTTSALNPAFKAKQHTVKKRLHNVSKRKMHCSRMCTVRCSSRVRGGGEYLPRRGVCLPEGGFCLSEGVSAYQGVGVCLRGRCVCPGGVCLLRRRCTPPM